MIRKRCRAEEKETKKEKAGIRRQGKGEKRKGLQNKLDNDIYHVKMAGAEAGQRDERQGKGQTILGDGRQFVREMIRDKNATLGSS